MIHQQYNPLSKLCSTKIKSTATFYLLPCIYITIVELMFETVLYRLSLQLEMYVVIEVKYPSATHGGARG